MMKKMINYYWFYILEILLDELLGNNGLLSGKFFQMYKIGFKVSMAILISIEKLFLI
jgi:hypothetical protein